MLDNQTGSSLKDGVAALQAARQANEPDLAEAETTGGTDEQAEVEKADTVQTDETEAEAVELEADDESGDEIEDDDDAEPRYTVKVDGQEVEVSIDEALKGYQRDQDYRKKTMALAEQRKSVEAQQNEYNETLERLASYMEQVEKETDWNSLRDNDPQEFIRQKELQEKRKAELEEGRKRQMEQRQKIIDAESNKLKETMGPTWDTERAKQDFEKAATYLKSMGVTDEEMNSFVDHRLWKMIFDASAYADMQKNKQKVIKEVKNAPKSVKSGQRKAKSQTELEQAKEKLLKSDKRTELASAVALLKAKRGK